MPRSIVNGLPWGVHTLNRMYNPDCMSSVNGTCYAFSVAEPYTAGRLRAAWWVLTGKAFALAWPKPGDLEAALGMPLWNRAAHKPSSNQARL